MPMPSRLALVTFLFVVAAPLVGRAAPGDLDLGFGDRGTSRHDLPGRLESVDGIVAQPDGKLLVSGGIDYLAPEGSFLVMRYLPDGALDPAFGTGGWVRTDFPGGSDFAYKVLVQPCGKIVAGGVVAPGDMALTRYESDGTLDATSASAAAWCRTSTGSSTACGRWLCSPTARSSPPAGTARAGRWVRAA